MRALLTKDFHKNLAEYFANKPCYLDLTDQRKPNLRKLIEQPWHLYILNDIKGLLNFYKNPIHFMIGSELADFNIYQKYLISSLEGYDRINAIWSLFGLHIGNGEDFLSCSGLLKLAEYFIKEDFGEHSPEYIKLCYWSGWIRKKIDDVSGAHYWFTKAKDIIITSSLTECSNYLDWCNKEIGS
jgi:hypothetical protein